MRLALAYILVSLTACNGSGNGNGKGDEPEPFDFSTIPDSPLSGVIGGAPFDFVAGTTDSFLSDDEQFFSSLFGEEADCTSEPFGTSSILVGIPTEPGEYEFNSSRNLTFYDAIEQINIATFNGGIVVDSVDSGQVFGRLYAMEDDENEVGGTFQATICE